MSRTEDRHCVHGRWLTTTEAAAELGITPCARRRYRQRRRCLLEDAYDHYDALRRGWLEPPRLGRPPRTYWVSGKKMTIAQAAERLGVTEHSLRGLMWRNRWSLHRACKHLQARQTDRAVKQILEIIGGEGK